MDTDHGMRDQKPTVRCIVLAAWISLIATAAAVLANPSSVLVLAVVLTCILFSLSRPRTVTFHTSLYKQTLQRVHPSRFHLPETIKLCGIDPSDLTDAHRASIRSVVESRASGSVHATLSIRQGSCILTLRLVGANEGIPAEELDQDVLMGALDKSLRAKIDRVLVSEGGEGAGAAAVHVESLPSLVPAAVALSEGSSNPPSPPSLQLRLPVTSLLVRGDRSEWTVSVYSHTRRLELPLCTSSHVGLDAVYVEVAASELVSPDVLDIGLKRSNTALDSLPSSATTAHLFTPVCSVLMTPSERVREEVARLRGINRDAVLGDLCECVCLLAAAGESQRGVHDAVACLHRMLNFVQGQTQAHALCAWIEHLALHPHPLPLERAADPAIHPLTQTFTDGAIEHAFNIHRFHASSIPLLAASLLDAPLSLYRVAQQTHALSQIPLPLIVAVSALHLVNKIASYRRQPSPSPYPLRAYFTWILLKTLDLHAHVTLCPRASTSLADICLPIVAGFVLVLTFDLLPNFSMRVATLGLFITLINTHVISGCKVTEMIAPPAGVGLAVWALLFTLLTFNERRKRNAFIRLVKRSFDVDKKES